MYINGKINSAVWLWVCSWAAGCALSIAVPVARPVATGGILGPCPPAEAQSPPPAKNSKINPILFTLKSYFLVYNITCKTQLNNKFNQHHFIYRRG